MACFNPLLAEKRRQKRERLLAATEANLTKLARGVSRRTKAPLSAGEIGVKAGRVIGRHKMAKHIRLTIRDGVFTWSRDEESIQTREFAGWDLCGSHQRASPTAVVGGERAGVQAAVAGGAVVPLPEGD